MSARVSEKEQMHMSVSAMINDIARMNECESELEVNTSTWTSAERHETQMRQEIRLGRVMDAAPTPGVRLNEELR